MRVTAQSHRHCTPSNGCGARVSLLQLDIQRILAQAHTVIQQDVPHCPLTQMSKLTAGSLVSAALQRDLPLRSTSYQSATMSGDGDVEMKTESKRGGGGAGQLIAVEKKQENTQMVVGETRGKQLVVSKTVARTSSLAAATMQLSGHEKPVNSVRFNPKGSYLASGGADNQILLWNVYGECKNWGVLKGHTGQILDLAWSSEGDQVYTASSDKTGAVFDAETCERVKQFRSHTSFVNAVSATRRGEPLVVTGSDDCTAMIWDLRTRHPSKTLTHEYQVTSACFSEDSSQVFTGSIDHNVYAWDLRKNSILHTLEGHQDSVTGVRLNAAGTHLLSNGMDNTLRTWDVRAYVSGGRLTGVFEGALHDFQKQLLRCAWSPDGSRITAGSSDRYVYVWEVATGRVLYKLPGHNGSVNEVDFHPTEPIIASGGNDKSIFLGEIAASA